MTVRSRVGYYAGTILVINCLFVSNSVSQKVHYGPERGVTNAAPGDVALSYGDQDKDAPNFKYYYNRQAYAAPANTPPPPTQEQILEATRARVMGPVARYSNMQYGNLVSNLLKSEAAEEGLPAPAPVSNAQAKSPTPASTPVQHQAGQLDTGTTAPMLHAGFVATVLDRGVIVTSSGLNIRLRGVAIPSMASTDAKRRQTAASAVASLRKMLTGRRIYYVVEQPEKGLDGSLLAIVHVRDGTELNRLALESGMGLFAPGDFPNESHADGLASAEADARKEHRGFWAE